MIIEFVTLRRYYTFVSVLFFCFLKPPHARFVISAEGKVTEMDSNFKSQPSVSQKQHLVTT